MAAKKCLICNEPFSGRRDAKTCSPRCRKRLQLIRTELQGPGMIGAAAVGARTKVVAADAAPAPAVSEPPRAPAKNKRRVGGPWLTVLALGLASLFSIFISGSPQKAQALTAASNLNFQARLLNSAGGVVPDGSYNIDFKIYNADSTTGTVGTCTGACLWEETRTNAGGSGVQVINGYFSVNLGSVTPFPTTINWDQQLYLTMNLTTNGTQAGAPISTDWNGEMQNSGHSIALTSVPLAFRANQLAVAGTNEQILQFASSTFGQATTISLPDPGAATATVCYQNSSSCGFAASSGNGNYIQNSTGGPQAANFNIISNAAGSPGGIIHANASQSVDIFDVNDSGSTNYLGVTSNGSLNVTPAAAGTITLGSTSQTGNIVVGQSTATNTISIGSGNPADTKTQTINIGNGNAAGTTSGGVAINIGNGTPNTNTTNSIHIGSGGTTTGTVAVVIGSNGNAAHTTAIQGGNGATAITLNPQTTGQIVIGAAAGTGAITLGSSSAGQTVQIANGAGAPTVNIANVSTAGVSINIAGAANTVANTISIANGASAANTTVNILSGAGTAGAGTLNLANNTRVTTIAIGNVAPAAARTTTIAGGNSAVVDTVNIATGNGTVAGAKTVHIADGTPTGSGTNLVTIGSIAALANTTTLQAGVNGANETLQLQVASGGVIGIGTAVSTSTVDIGSVGANTSASTIKIANTTNGTSVQSVSIGSNANAGNVLSLDAGNTGAISIGTSTTAHTINIGTGGTNTQAINIGSINGSSAVQILGGTGASALSFQAGTNGTIGIGSSNANTINIGNSSGNAVAVNSGNANISLTTNGAGNPTVTVKSTQNSTAAFQIQNSSGASGVLLNADTTNMRISIGSGGTAAGQLYVSGSVPTSTLSVTGTTDVLPVSVVTAGNYLFELNWTTGTIRSYDISNPASPAFLASASTTGAGSACNGGDLSGHSLAIAGKYLYAVSCAANALDVFNISNPSSFSRTSTLSTGASTGPISLYVAGRYAYLVNDTSAALQIVDISNPANMVSQSITSISAGTHAQDIYIQNRYAYVITSQSTPTLKIFDITNALGPSAPGGSLALGTTPSGIVVSGRYAYIAEKGSNQIRVVDVSNPASISTVSTFAVGSGPVTLKLQGKYLYVDEYTANQIQIIDTSNPASLSIVGTLSVDSGPLGLAISGRYGYITNSGTNEISAVDLGGGYIQQLQAGDLQSSTLHVDGNSMLAGDVNIQGSTNIGQTLLVNGSASIGQQLMVGSSSQSGIITFNNSAGSNTVALALQANPTSSYTLLLPTTAPAVNQCMLTDSVTANQLKFGACSTLNTAYAGGTGPSDSTITLDTTRKGVVIQDAVTPIGSNLFTVQANGSNATPYLNVTASNVAVNNSTDFGGNTSYIDTAYGGLGQYYNLLQQSEAFDNAVWSKTTITVTADNQTAPDGNNSADTLADTAGGGGVSQAYTTSTIGTYTFSVWLKASANINTSIRIDSTGTNAQTGTSKVVPVTTTWQRFYVTQSITGPAISSIVANVFPAGGASGTVYGWGAQLVTGSSALVYERTGSAAATSSNTGLYVSGASLFKPTTDTANAFQIQNASSNSIFNVNTTAGGNVTIQTDISSQNLSASALTVTQASSASFNNSAPLVTFINNDPGNSQAVLDLQNVGTTGVQLQMAGDLTAGNSLRISGTGNGSPNASISFATAGTPFSGSYIQVNPSRHLSSGTGTYTESGNFLSLNRSDTNDTATGTYAITGDLATLSSNCTQNTGTCTDNSSILNLQQQFSGSTGTVLKVQGNGSGNLVDVIDTTSTAQSVFTIANEGASTFKNRTNSAAAFLIQKASASDTLFTADTQNNKIVIGNATASSSADTTLLQVDSSTTTNLPAASAALNGSIVYDSTAGKMKIIEGGVYKTLCNTTDLACGSGGTSTLLNSYNAGTLASDQTILTQTTKGGAVTVKDNNTNTVNGVIFQVQNSTGGNILSANSSSMQVVIGSGGTATGQLYVSGTLPTSALASVSTGASTDPFAATVLGNYVYEVNYANSTMKAFDVSNPAAPVQVGSNVTIGGAGESCNAGDTSDRSIFGAGHYVYIALCASKLFEIYDVSQPASIVKVSSSSTGVTSAPLAVYVSGRYAYVINDMTNSTLQVFDISNPINPISLSVTNLVGNHALNVFVQGSLAYVAVGGSGTPELMAYDVSNPVSPILKGTVSTGATPQGLWVQGRYAYVANFSGNSLQVIDVSNPTSMSVSGTLSTGASTGPQSVAVQGRYAYLANYTSGKIQVVNISVPGSPTSVGTVTVGSSPYSLYAQGRYVYTVNSDNTLKVFDMGGAYLQQLEAGGAQVGTLNVQSNSILGGDVNIQGGVTIGQRLQVAADVGVTGKFTVGAGKPTLVGNASTSQSSRGLAMQGHYVYDVDNLNLSFSIFDVSNPASPVEVGSASTADDGNDIAVQGRYAYVVTVTGLQVYDVSNPSSPSDITSGGVALTGSGNWIVVQGRYAYIGESGVTEIYDVANPAKPVLAGSVAVASDRVFVQGRYLYAISASLSKLHVFNVSNPASPSEVTTTGGVSTVSNPESIYVQGRYAYIAGGSSNKLQVFDISTPSSPTDVSSGGVTASGGPMAVYVQGSYAYVATGSTNKLMVFDVSNPAAPVDVSSGGGSMAGVLAEDLIVSGRYAYVADDQYPGIDIFDVGGAKVNQFEAGGANFGTLSVDSNSMFAADVNIQGGATVGQSLQVDGDLGLKGKLTVATSNGYGVSILGNGSATSSYSLTLPVAGASGTKCLQSTSGSTTTSTVLQFGTCSGGGSGTLQDAYDASGSPATITTSSSTKGVLIAAGTGAGGAGTPALVQQATGGGSAANTYTATFPGNTTSGNLVVANIALVSGGSKTVGSVQGKLSGSNVGSTWTCLSYNATSGNNTYSQLCYLPNAPVMDSVVVTIALGATATGSVHASEWSGIVTTSPLDTSGGTSAASGVPTTGTSNTITTNAANDLIIASASTSAAQSALSSPWSNLTAITTNRDLYSVYQIGATASSSYNDAVWSSSTSWGTSYATFKAATGGTTSYDSTNLFQIQNSAGTSLLNVDSVNSQISLGGDLSVGSRFGSRLFSDNFESGSFNLWTNGPTGAATTIDSSTVHDGKYSAKVNPSGSVNYLQTNISSTSSTEYLRFWTKVSSGSVDATMAVIANPAETGGSNGSWIASVYRQGTSGYFCLFNQYSNTSSCSTTAISSTAWHLVEIKIIVNGASGSMTGWLDGTQLVNATSQNLGTVNGSQLILGEPITSRTETEYFDDVSMDTVSNGTASSLNVDDSLHVGGSASFGSNVLVNSFGPGTTPFTIDDTSTGVNLLQVQDMSQNFGGLVSSGAFLSNLSGGRQDFTASKTGTATSGSTGGFGDDGKWYVNNSAATVTTGLTTSNPNGYIRIAPGTTSGTGGEVAFGATAGTLDKLFTPNNDLPVVQMKVRPSTMVATDDLVWGMMDTATAPTTNNTTPTNGIFFYSNNGTGATGWQGVVTLGGSTIGSVTCPGTATANKWATGRISVLSSDASHTYVDFMIDNDASDGVQMLDCGTVTTSSLWTAATTLGYGMYDVHTSTTGGNTFDLDYTQWWQDDNTAVGGTSDSAAVSDAANSPAPLTEDNVPQTTAAQTGIIDFTTATSEDVTFNGNVYVHGTLYADKIKANEIDGLSIFTDQLSSLQAQLSAVQAASTSNVSGSGSESSGSSEDSEGSNGALTLNISASGLTVGGDANFQGNVFFYKLVTFTQKAIFNNDITLGGHITTAGAAPTLNLEAAAGITVAPPPDPSNPDAPMPKLAKDTITGNDNSGSLSVTFGDNAAAGQILTVKFDKPYSGAPSVFLTPTNQAAAGLKYYVTSAADGYKIIVIDPPAAGTTLNFNYFVIQ